MIRIESPTRITLALDIIRRLEDGPLTGYHELGIVKHQIALADTLIIEPYNGNRDLIECDDPRVPRNDSNICIKACRLVREKFGINKHLRISIDKKIPVMGGMAGGSANAAATLRGLSDLWELNLTADQYKKFGLELGMDVPFFFTGGTAFDSETTGIIESICTDLIFHIILAIPEFGVSTKEAYGSIDYKRIGKNVSQTNGIINALKRGDFDTVAELMHNDFELTVFEKHPRLKNIRDNLLSAGCAAAVMSGSGSTIIGIAQNNLSARKIAAETDCQTVITKSLNPII